MKEFILKLTSLQAEGTFKKVGSTEAKRDEYARLHNMNVQVKEWESLEYVGFELSPDMNIQIQIMQ